MTFKTKQNLYTSGEIKREAKAQLRGSWGPAVLMAVLPTIFFFLFIRNTTAASLWSLLMEIIRSYLVVGVTFGFMNLLRNNNFRLEALQEIISPFRSKYFRNLLFLILLKYLFIFLWSLLFIIPGIVKGYAYAQAELIYKDTVDRTGRQPSALECIKESQELMKGNKTDLFVLELSFIGWSILNAFTYGILSLWLTPYMTMSQVVFYENITDGHYLKGTEQTKNTKANSHRADKDNEEVGKDPDDFRDFNDF